MLQITFEYKDKYTHGRWAKQTCTVPSLDDCKKLYGLGVDCEYHILAIIGPDGSMPIPKS